MGSPVDRSKAIKRVGFKTKMEHSRGGVSKIILLCEDFTSLGGIRSFILTFTDIARTLDLKLALVSKYARGPSRSVPGIVDVEVIHSDEYICTSDKIEEVGRQSPEGVILQRRLQDMRAAGRRRLLDISRGWSESDVVIALQVPILDDLLRAGFDLSVKGRPAILAQYHGTYDYARKQTYFAALISAFKKVDVGVFLSRGDAEKFRAAGVQNVEAIPNSVPSRSLVDPAPLLTRDRVAVFMGRLHPEKNLESMVKGWKILGSRNSGWQLRMYGAGPEEQKIRGLVAQLGLSESISLMGEVVNVAEVYSRAQLNLMTSMHEGMPMSILEAASFGVPTVCFDAGPGTRELVNDGVTGLVSPAGSLDTWVDKLARVMTDDHLRESLGMSCMELASEYSVGEVAKRWSALFDRLSRRGGKGDVVEAMAETEMGAMKFKEVSLPHDCSKLRLDFGKTGKDPLPEKSLLLTIRGYDSTGADVSRTSVRLPWSRLTGTSFVNFPELSPENAEVSFDVELDGTVKRLEVSVMPWGRKRFSPNRVITWGVLTAEVSLAGRSCWLSAKLDCEGDK